MNVSCNATVTGSEVHEHQDRVSIDVETRARGGNCPSVLIVRDVSLRLRAPLGVRWLDGACANGCPTEPAQSAVRCTLAPPFGFGFLPSGWSSAKDPPAGVIAAYQSANGEATIELSQDGSADPQRQATDQDVFVLGTSVPVLTVPGGYAVTIDLAGRGAGCGAWLLVGRGAAQSTFVTIAQQLFPR